MTAPGEIGRGSDLVPGLYPSGSYPNGAEVDARIPRGFGAKQPVSTNASLWTSKSKKTARLYGNLTELCSSLDRANRESMRNLGNQVDAAGSSGESTTTSQRALDRILEKAAIPQTTVTLPTNSWWLNYLGSGGALAPVMNATAAAKTASGTNTTGTNASKANITVPVVNETLMAEIRLASLVTACERYRAAVALREEWAQESYLITGRRGEALRAFREAFVSLEQTAGVTKDSLASKDTLLDPRYMRRLLVDEPGAAACTAGIAPAPGSSGGQIHREHNGICPPTDSTGSMEQTPLSPSLSSHTSHATGGTETVGSRNAADTLDEIRRFALLSGVPATLRTRCWETLPEEVLGVDPANFYAGRSRRIRGGTPRAREGGSHGSRRLTVRPEEFIPDGAGNNDNLRQMTAQFAGTATGGEVQVDTRLAERAYWRGQVDTRHVVLKNGTVMATRDVDAGLDWYVLEEREREKKKAMLPHPRNSSSSPLLLNNI